ncbi:MAG: ATP-binding protein, partial [Clostridium sp.]|nr:ATP-binding protein [Clostridium sp.]
MTKEELIARLQDIEWDDFEVKEAKNELPKNIWETVSAFSNASGGWIILGIRQRGKSFEIQGVDDAEKLEQDFIGTLRSQKFNVRLYASTSQYNIGGKKILAFYIPSSSNKPVYFGNPANS